MPTSWAVTSPWLSLLSLASPCFQSWSSESFQEISNGKSKMKIRNLKLELSNNNGISDVCVYTVYKNVTSLSFAQQCNALFEGCARTPSIFSLSVDYVLSTDLLHVPKHPFVWRLVSQIIWPSFFYDSPLCLARWSQGWPVGSWNNLGPH